MTSTPTLTIQSFGRTTNTIALATSLKVFLQLVNTMHPLHNNKVYDDTQETLGHDVAVHRRSTTIDPTSGSWVPKWVTSVAHSYHDVRRYQGSNLEVSHKWGPPLLQLATSHPKSPHAMCMGAGLDAKKGMGARIPKISTMPSHRTHYHQPSPKNK